MAARTTCGKGHGAEYRKEKTEEEVAHSEGIILRAEGCSTKNRRITLGEHRTDVWGVVLVAVCVLSYSSPSSNLSGPFGASGSSTVARLLSLVCGRSSFHVVLTVSLDSR